MSSKIETARRMEAEVLAEIEAAKQAVAAAATTVTPLPSVPAMPLSFFDDCLVEPQKNWAIRHVIALDEDSSWFGPPGATKSMLLTDIGIHLAAGRDWRGYRIKQPMGVVFFALERAHLTRRRIAAYAKRDGYTGLAIAVGGQIVSLLDPACVEYVASTIRTAEAKFGCPVGLIIVDSWAKAIGAGGGDEDKAQHVNVAAANLKRIHDAIGHPIHIATIGHSGKDASKGERGSNAKLGHVDLEVCISGDVTKSAAITKGNDQGKDALCSYVVESIIIGEDDEGEPETAGIVSADVVVRAESKKKRSQRQDIALNCLEMAIRLDGRDAPNAPGFPTAKVALVDRWRTELLRAGVIDKDGSNPRADFKRMKTALIAGGDIGELEGMVWVKHPVGAPMLPERDAAPMPYSPFPFQVAAE